MYPYIVSWDENPISCSACMLPWNWGELMAPSRVLFVLDQGYLTLVLSWEKQCVGSWTQSSPPWRQPLLAPSNWGLLTSSCTQDARWTARCVLLQYRPLVHCAVEGTLLWWVSTPTPIQLSGCWAACPLLPPWCTGETLDFSFKNQRTFTDSATCPSSPLGHT